MVGQSNQVFLYFEREGVFTLMPHLPGVGTEIEDLSCDKQTIAYRTIKRSFLEAISQHTEKVHLLGL